MERKKKTLIPASLFLVCFSTRQCRIPPSTFSECAVWPLIREPGGGGVKGQREWGRENFFSPNYDKIKSMPDTAEEVETAAVYFQQGLSTIRRSG